MPTLARLERVKRKWKKLLGISTKTSSKFVQMKTEKVPTEPSAPAIDGAHQKLTVVEDEAASPLPYKDGTARTISSTSNAGLTAHRELHPPASLATVPPTPGSKIIKDAMKALEEPERAVIKEYADLEHPAQAFHSVLAAAAESKDKYNDKGSWTIKGYRIEWRVLLGNIVKLLDKFKDIGDALSSLDPVHAGIPWAVVKVLLSIALASAALMKAVLSGLESALTVGNRLKVYYEYLPELEESPAKKNFEDGLLNMQTTLWKFLARAIILYKKNAIARTWIALWGSDGVTSFDDECCKIGQQVEIEASNCDREISHSIRSKLDALDKVKESFTEISAEILFPTLKYADGARYNSADESDRPRCLEETRVEVLDEIYRWAESEEPGEPHIFWLQGSAGTGKSTISRTVAHFLDDTRLLGASFFFIRDVDLRNNSRQLFTTIALDLVRSFPIMQERVSQEIKEDPHINTMGLEVHFEKLILEPCKDFINNGTIIVLVIDALDECADQRAKILEQLERAAEVRRGRLRIFLTSRPEIVDQEKREEKYKSTYRHFSLDDSPDTANDISRYFTNTFAHMSDKPDEPADWPGRLVVEELTNRAVPSFISAATVCRFICDRDFIPAEQLELIQKFSYPELASELDKTYLPVLAQLVGGQDKIRDQRLQSQFHNLLGIVVMLADPLPVRALTTLLDEKTMSLAIVKLRLGRLRSVLRIPDDDDTSVRVFHQSFRDFLVDPAKKDHHWFWIDQQEVHGMIARNCFNLLNKKGVLGRDLGGFRKPGLQRSKLEQQQVNSKIAPQVQYACRFWAYHLENSIRQGSAMDLKEPRKRMAYFWDPTEILQFLETHFLHWIETLGWMGKLENGIQAIIFFRILFSTERDSQLFLFLDDAYRFLLKHRYVIDLAPAQLYSSALIFSPKTSAVRRKFEGEIRGYSRLPDVSEAWTSELLRLQGHTHKTTGSAFSSDGQLIASSSSDQTIRLWNSTTGAPVHELKGHEGEVSGVVFDRMKPPKVLASWSKDRTVRIWDVSTGRPLRVLHLQGEASRGVSFSSESVLACTSGMNVILWAKPWEKELQKIPFQDRVYMVQFCTTSEMLTVAAGLSYLRHWDYVNRRELQDTVEFRAIHNAASLDGRLLTSRGPDGSIQIRHGSTLKVVTDLADSYNARVHCFSLNGELIVGTNASDCQVWNTKTGVEIARLKHSSRVGGLSVSDDGRLLVSCWDTHLTLWDLTCHDKTLSAETTPRLVHCACSEDGSKFAFLGKDSSVMMFNFGTTQAMTKLSVGDGQVDEKDTEVLLSPDGRWLLYQSHRVAEARIADLHWSTEVGKHRTLPFTTFKRAKFSDDGQILAIVKQGLLTIWVFADSTDVVWREVYRRDGLQDVVVGLAFSHDASTRTLAIGFGGSVHNSPPAQRPEITEIEILNLKSFASRSNRMENNSHPLVGMAFSTNDQTVVAWGSEQFVSFDLTKREIEMLQRIDIHTSKLSDTGYINSDDSLLITELGAVPLPVRLGADGPRTQHSPAIFYYGQWISRDGENLLWLPQEYVHKNMFWRGMKKVACTQNRLCIIPSQGPIAFFEFSDSSEP